MSLDVSRQELTVHLERAFLVSVALPDRPWVSKDPLEELRGLATTAGALVVGGLTQQRDQINPATYIGKGKLEELQQQVQATDADVVIFDNDLSPGQGEEERQHRQAAPLQGKDDGKRRHDQGAEGVPRRQQAAPADAVT